MRILLVEDDVHHARYLTKVLKSAYGDQTEVQICPSEYSFQKSIDDACGFDVLIISQMLPCATEQEFDSEFSRVKQFEKQSGDPLDAGGRIYSRLAEPEKAKSIILALSPNAVFRLSQLPVAVVPKPVGISAGDSESLLAKFNEKLLFVIDEVLRRVPTPAPVAYPAPSAL